MSGWPRPTGTGTGNAVLVESGSPAKVSAFPAAAALAGTELLPLVQSGADVRSTVSAVAAASPGNTAILVESGSAAKVSALPPAAAALTGAELVPTVQAGATDQTTAQAIANLSQFLSLNWAPADGAYSGVTALVTYGASLVPGDVVYFNAAGDVRLADANTPGTFPLFALALETANSGTHRVLLFGTYRNDARYNWATVGGLLWLSTTAGEQTQAQPSATGDAIQPLGFAISADIVLFRPDLTWLTHV